MIITTIIIIMKIVQQYTLGMGTHFWRRRWVGWRVESYISINANIRVYVQLSNIYLRKDEVANAGSDVLVSDINLTVKHLQHCSKSRAPGSISVLL